MSSSMKRQSDLGDSDGGFSLTDNILWGVVAVTILGTGLFVGWYFIYTETQVGKKQNRGSKRSARLVETETIQSDTYPVRIEAMGTVEPARKTVLEPRVSGTITNISDTFIPGGIVKEGQSLIQIDRSDYQLTLKRRKSDLKQAEADLEIEQGNQAVAQYEYEEIGGQVEGEDKSLILREPQLKRVKSQVESARAAVREAELNLQRTRISVPYNAQILDRQVNLGSNVAPGNPLATVVGTDRYWIEVSVPVSRLRWISIPDRPGEIGSHVWIYNEDAWGPDEYRVGFVRQLLGRLEDDSRMAQLLVVVPDPLLINAPDKTGPRLMLGSYVTAIFRGRELPGSVRLDRSLLRENDKVWILNNQGKLDIRSVKLVEGSEQHVYVTSGLESGEQVIKTNLGSPVDGMKLRTESPAPSQPGNDESTDKPPRTQTKVSFQD